MSKFIPKKMKATPFKPTSVMTEVELELVRSWKRTINHPTMHIRATPTHEVAKACRKAHELGIYHLI